MRNDIFRTKFPILGAAILLAVLIAGCTGSQYGQPTTTPPTTPATTVPTPEATTPATIVTTIVPTVQVTATMLNQTNVSVTIQNFAFSPQFVTVSNGTTVTWTNLDPTPHQIVNDPTIIPGVGQIFKSSPLETGQSYSFTFTSTGMFPYHCNIHPNMVGKFDVR
jgi:plastocyanin